MRPHPPRTRVCLVCVSPFCRAFLETWVWQCAMCAEGHSLSRSARAMSGQHIPQGPSRRAQPRTFPQHFWAQQESSRTHSTGSWPPPGPGPVLSVLEAPASTSPVRPTSLHLQASTCQSPTALGTDLKAAHPTWQFHFACSNTLTSYRKQGNSQRPLESC